MFEDQPTKPTTPPANLPIEPEDIFAGVEEVESAPPAAAGAADALKAGLLKRKSSLPTAPSAAPGAPAVTTLPMPPVSFETKAPVAGKILFAVIGIALVAGVSWGGWKLYQMFKTTPASPVAPAQPLPTAAAPAPQPAAVPEPTPVAVSVATSTAASSAQKNDQLLFGQPVDTDKDGLDDIREKELGTDFHNFDTDGDGLTDGEEVNAYKTNPLLKDTDGDGLSDGDEAAIWHTNPINPDTDADGFTDGREIYNGYNPIGAGKLVNLPPGVTSSTLRSFVMVSTTPPSK